jgi:hypothetical protein
MGRCFARGVPRREDARAGLDTPDGDSHSHGRELMDYGLQNVLLDRPRSFRKMPLVESFLRAVMAFCRIYQVIGPPDSRIGY